ncbi:hypothetical protein F4823DRAFT_421637 [Ustulina deusta]|nr:hypothetical protein F4823DRAFT_421637 [Ustulina deusta]
MSLMLLMSLIPLMPLTPLMPLMSLMPPISLMSPIAQELFQIGLQLLPQYIQVVLDGIQRVNPQSSRISQDMGYHNMKYPRTQNIKGQCISQDIKYIIGHRRPPKFATNGGRPRLWTYQVRAYDI